MTTFASPLAQRIRRRIESDGPLTFAAFMEAALYDPEEGFYSHAPVGEAGHFVTSPHVSPVFGTLIARQIEELWQLLDRPAQFAVIEAGAGSGVLAAQVLDALPASLAADTTYVAVERSAAARDAIRPPSDALSRPILTAATIDEVSPGRVGCVIANELLDNLPFHRLRGTEQGNVELFVGLASGDDPGGFVLCEGPISTPELERLIPRLGPGEEAVASLEALRFVERAAGLLDRGYLWIVDYGWASPSQGHADLVHGYRRHRVEDDVLADPGSRDITSGVDFAVLVRRAKELGLQVWGPVTQRESLLALGFRDWDEAARARQVEATRARHGIDALRTYSDRNRAALLIDPAGLGRFLVLCLGVGVSADHAPRAFRTVAPA